MFSTGLVMEALCGADVVERVRVVKLVFAVVRVVQVAILVRDVSPQHRDVRLDCSVVALGEDGLAKFDLR